MSSFDGPGAGSASTDDGFERFCRIRAHVGLRAALGYLSAFTGYRHAAVIRRVADRPAAVAYYDRDRPDEEQPERWPAAVAASCLVRDDGGRLREVRELPVPAAYGSERAALACQCVPVIDRDGELHASLCVFDDATQLIEEADLSLLLRVAASLAQEGDALAPRASQPSDGAGQEEPDPALDALHMRRRRASASSHG
jgi:hypothetical protein